MTRTTTDVTETLDALHRALNAADKAAGNRREFEAERGHPEKAEAAAGIQCAIDEMRRGLKRATEEEEKLTG